MTAFPSETLLPSKKEQVGEKFSQISSSSREDRKLRGGILKYSQLLRHNYKKWTPYIYMSLSYLLNIRITHSQHFMGLNSNTIYLFR